MDLRDNDPEFKDSYKNVKSMSSPEGASWLIGDDGG